MTITAICWPPPGFHNIITLAILCRAAGQRAGHNSWTMRMCLAFLFAVIVILSCYNHTSSALGPSIITTKMLPNSKLTRYLGESGPGSPAHFFWPNLKEHFGGTACLTPK